MLYHLGHVLWFSEIVILSIKFEGNVKSGMAQKDLWYSVNPKTRIIA